MTARITHAEVAHIARLARLNFTDHELEVLATQLAAVLDHAADVEAMDVSGVEPTARPVPLVNVFREDELRPSLERDEVMAQAPSVAQGQFRVPPVLGDDA